MGIIGPNGAGKTTILKLLSKVTFPTKGAIHVNGRFSALIELGAGFHPDLIWARKYLSETVRSSECAGMRFRLALIKIVEFAEIGKFLDTPVKRYSSGMYARLGFAVAAHVDPEVLIVDEVLAVGDMAFQRKCYEHMVQMIQNGTTLVFVSHNLRAVQRVCANCLVMYKGYAAFEGPTPEATAAYSNILRSAAADYAKTHPGEIEGGISQMIMTHEAVIESVQLLRPDGSQSISFQSGETVKLRMQVRFNEDSCAPIFACSVRTPEMEMVYDFTTHWAHLPTQDFEANDRANN
jgi:lipopolysaccharide transport system ATP-binding protein